MSKIEYKGMQLKEFTSDKPVAFAKGTKALVWDIVDGKPNYNECYVIAYIPYMYPPVFTESKDGRQDSSWDHCAIIFETISEASEEKANAEPAPKNSRTATGEYYDGEVETIVYLERLATALVKNVVDPKRVYNIVAATKYLSSRLGAKADQPIELDLMKAENYIHRARTGKWLPKERLDPFGE